MSGYESVFLCAVTRVVGGGAGAWSERRARPSSPTETLGLDQGPSGEARPFTSARKKKKKKGCVGSCGVGGLVCGR